MFYFTAGVNSALTQMHGSRPGECGSQQKLTPPVVALTFNCYHHKGNAVRIYLAGPLFTSAERAFNSRLRDLLVAAGHEVWLPQDHEPRDKSAAAIFSMDVEGIKRSDVIVANMDGADPDSGTCWECGYAYRKKKIIVFRTDFRSAGEGETPFNLMLSESADYVLKLPPFSSVEALAQKLSFVLERRTEERVARPRVARPRVARR